MECMKIRSERLLYLAALRGSQHTLTGLRNLRKEEAPMRVLFSQTNAGSALARVPCCSRLRRLLAVCLALAIVLLPGAASAATPSSGTMSQTNPTVTWTGQVPTVPAAGSSSCSGPNNPGCDNFKLTIIPPDPTFCPYVVVIQTISQGTDDWDLEVYDPNGKLIGSSGNGPGTPNSPEVETVTLANPPDYSACRARCPNCRSTSHWGRTPRGPSRRY